MSKIKSMELLNIQSVKKMELATTNGKNVILFLKHNKCIYTQQFLPSWDKFLENDKYVNLSKNQIEKFEIFELEGINFGIAKKSDYLMRFLEKFEGFPTVFLLTRDNRIFSLIGLHTLSDLKKFIKMA